MIIAELVIVNEKPCKEEHPGKIKLFDACHVQFYLVLNTTTHIRME